MAGAIHAAENPAFTLHSMPDDPAVAVVASRRQPVDGALETVKRVRLAPARHGEGLVVIVAAGVALRHGRAGSKIRVLQRMRGGKSGVCEKTFRPCCALHSV